MYGVRTNSARSQKFWLIMLCVAFLSTSTTLACTPCASLSRISRLFSRSQKNKAGSSAENDGKILNGRMETYWKELEKMLDDPAFVHVAASQQDKGTAATIKSENDTKTDAIPLENKGTMIAMHPEGGEAYVTSPKSNKVLVLDLKTRKVLNTINTEDEPYGIASSPDAKQVYITHHKSNYISILDTETNKITETITVKEHPATITLSFDGSRAYVGHTEYTEYKEGSTTEGAANSPGSNEISIIDLKTNKVISNIATKGSTWSIAVQSDGSRIFATTYEPFIGSFKDFQAMGKWSQGWNGITIIDTAQNKISSEIQIPEHIVPHSIALTPDDKKAYIIGSGSDEARVLDVASLTIKTKIPLGLGG